MQPGAGTTTRLLRRWLRLFGWNFRNDGRHFPRLLLRYGLSYSFGGTFLKALRLFPAGLFTPAAAAAATASATATAAIGLLTFIGGASVYRRDRKSTRLNSSH